MLPQAHPAPEPVYFARVSAGLEQLAWGDIERHTGARLLGLGHRRVDFACAAAPAGLLALRAVDDVYVRVARLRGLDHTRASLGRLTRKLGEVDFDPALALIAQVRTLPEYPMYRVTASHLGRRNYSRYDIEGAVEQALTLRLPWRFVLNAADEPMPDLDLRVLLEADWALLGLRLGAAPLHRRDYKVAERPGALKPPVAYCLALLAGCAPGQVLLDPACGAGTILAEALALVPGGTVIGGDTDVDALMLAQMNLAALGAPAPIIEATTTRAPDAETAGSWLYQGDARAIPLAAGAIDTLVCNLPWGRQAPAGHDIAALYCDILREAARVLRPGGRAVLLTDRHAELRAALAAATGLQPAAELPISLFGSHPAIYLAERLPA